jgi:hypothetical protein
MFFNAGNGPWTQDIQLKLSAEQNIWLAATRVRGKGGDVRYEYSGSEYELEFGAPIWQP